jgi:DNA-binding transcriptional MerR regulator
MLWYIVTRGENMEENLITKKELLELTGISYGALYRWKRMKLLPDEWFIHRSTFTGHETFFPRDKVLSRVEEIQQLKETMSLEDIAKRFRPGPPGQVSLTAQEAAEAGIAVPPVINQYLSLSRKEGSFSYEELLGLYTFSSLLLGGSVSREEAYELSQAVVAAEDISEPIIYLLRKYGVPFCVTAGEMQKLKFDSSAVLAETVSVSAQKAALGALLAEKGIIS